MLTRRMLMAGVAPGAALVVAGCTSAQIATAQQDFATFVDQVNNILRAGCSSLLPAFTATANTIAAVASVLYPSIAAAVSTGAAAVQAVASALCSTIPAAPAAQLRAKSLRAAAAGAPAPVLGYVVVNGKTITVTGYAR